MGNGRHNARDRATRLLLGESIDASAAHDLGLVNEVVPANRLMETADRRARELAAFSTVALRALTAATRRQRAAATLERLDAAIAIYQTTLAPSHDAGEGIRAFMEKRPPLWSHR